MANGERCKKCGHQETDHESRHLAIKPNVKRYGYKIRLTQCKGFVSPTGYVEPELSKLEIESLERRAQGNAAMGAYSAMQRTANFKREVRERNRRIEGKSSGEEKDALVKELREFVDRSMRNNVIHIGPF